MSRALLLLLIMGAAGAADRVDWSWREPLTAWATARGLTLTEVGDGPFRVIITNPAHQPQARIAAEAGNKALTVLDRLTGGLAGFAATNGAMVAYRSVYLPNDRTVDAWIDEARRAGLIGRPVGEDLAKMLHTISGPRIRIDDPTTMVVVPANEGTYDAVAMAIDHLYATRSGAARRRAPAWIREGLLTVLQAQLCGRITHTTVSYEMSDRTHGGSWGADVARHLRTPGVGQAASTLMSLELDGMAIEIYQQLHSLMAFTLEAGKGMRVRKGGAMPLWRLMRDTADGRAGEEVFAEVYGAKEPVLTRAWQTWALKQK